MLGTTLTTLFALALSAFAQTTLDLTSTTFTDGPVADPSDTNAIESITQTSVSASTTTTITEFGPGPVYVLSCLQRERERERAHCMYKCQERADVPRDAHHVLRHVSAGDRHTDGIPRVSTHRRINHIRCRLANIQIVPLIQSRRLSPARR